MIQYIHITWLERVVKLITFFCSIRILLVFRFLYTDVVNPWGSSLTVCIARLEIDALFITCFFLVFQVFYKNVVICVRFTPRQCFVFLCISHLGENIGTFKYIYIVRLEIDVNLNTCFFSSYFEFCRQISWLYAIRPSSVCCISSHCPYI